jgi:uncharacterized protein YndB with AHSA1/START domain
MSANEQVNLPSGMIIERTFKADVRQLWELWTTKDGFESWWGSEGSRVEVHTIEARQGGALHYHMIAIVPEDLAARERLGLAPASSVRARFSEFNPYRRLVLSHIIDFVPGIKPYEQHIAVDFSPSRDGVRMVTTIEPMHNEEFTQTSISVFAGQLKRLEERFEKP